MAVAATLTLRDSSHVEGLIEDNAYSVVLSLRSFNQAVLSLLPVSYLLPAIPSLTSPGKDSKDSSSTVLTLSRFTTSCTSTM